MKQKILFLSFIISILLLSCTTAKVSAEVVEVRSLTTFSTAKPPSTIAIEVLQPVCITQDICVEAGTELKGDLVDVKSPKRLKRNAKFSFVSTSYKGQDGLFHKINEPVKAKLTKPVNKRQVVGKTALSIGNFFVKGLSMGVAAVKGAFVNEEDNRGSSCKIYQRWGRQS